MTDIATFLLTFAAGPAAFWVLARQKATQTEFALLCAIAAALVGLAWALPRYAGVQWQDWALFGVIILMALWFAWIFVLAMCVQAVRHRLPEGPAHRWAFALGAMATTLPWFGLHLAQLVAK